MIVIEQDLSAVRVTLLRGACRALEHCRHESDVGGRAIEGSEVDDEDERIHGVRRHAERARARQIGEVRRVPIRRRRRDQNAVRIGGERVGKDRVVPARESEAGKMVRDHADHAVCADHQRASERRVDDVVVDARGELDAPFAVEDPGGDRAAEVPDDRQHDAAARAEEALLVRRVQRAVAGDRVFLDVNAARHRREHTAHRVRVRGAAVADAVLPNAASLDGLQRDAAERDAILEQRREVANLQLETALDDVVRDFEVDDDSAADLRQPAQPRADDVRRRDAARPHSLDPVVVDQDLVEKSFRLDFRRWLVGPTRRQRNDVRTPVVIEDDDESGKQHASGTPALDRANDADEAAEQDAVAVAADDVIAPDIDALAAAAQVHAADHAAQPSARRAAVDLVALDEHLLRAHGDRGHHRVERKQPAKQAAGKRDLVVDDVDAARRFEIHCCVRDGDLEPLERQVRRDRALVVALARLDAARRFETQPIELDELRVFDVDQRPAVRLLTGNDEAAVSAPVDANAPAPDDADAADVTAGEHADLAAARGQRLDRVLNGRELSEALDAVADGIGAARLDARERRERRPAVVDHRADERVVGVERPRNQSERRDEPAVAVRLARRHQLPRNDDVSRFGTRGDDPVIAAAELRPFEFDAQSRVAERDCRAVGHESNLRRRGEVGAAVPHAHEHELLAGGKRRGGGVLLPCRAERQRHVRVNRDVVRVRVERRLHLDEQPGRLGDLLAVRQQRAPWQQLDRLIGERPVGLILRRGQQMDDRPLRGIRIGLDLHAVHR